MAIPEVSATHQYPISTQLKRLQDKVRIDPAQAHDPDHSNVGRILHTADASQVCCGVSAPIAAKSNNHWLELSVHNLFSFVKLRGFAPIGRVVESLSGRVVQGLYDSTTRLFNHSTKVVGISKGCRNSETFNYPPRAASTMVRTWVSIKWRTSAAPVGQATAQAPQPLHSAP